MNYLLDTCFVSDLVKVSPNAGVLDWVSHQAENALFLSVVSVGEIQAGINKLPDSPRKANLASWLHNDLLPRFAGRVIAIDTDIALMWGAKRGEAAMKGIVLPLADSQIAATAISRGMTVITRNTADLQRCGAVTLNPWS